MKKNLFILAAALAVCYSCSNDEVIESAALNDSNAISFRPLMNKMTRAADANLTTTGFRVTATKTSDASKVYFSNVDFTSSTPATTFASATKYYWPSSYNLDFFAYAPIASDVVGDGKQIIPWETTTPGYDANSFKTFKVTPATAAASQVDFVYANTDAWGKIDQDPSNAGTHTHYIDGTPEGVTINFRHTESKVAVKLYNSNSSNITVLVRDVSICNINTVGVFTYDDSGNTDTQNTTTAADGNIFAQSLWTPSTPGSYTQTVAATENEDDFNVAVGSAAQFGEDWILIPQSLTYATAYDNTASTPYPFAGVCLKIRLQIKNAAGETEFIVGGTANTGGADSDGYVTALWPLSSPAGGWVPGTKYTYTVDLAGGGYWEKNDTGDQALDPILAGAEIKFVTVTIDTWDEADGSIYTGATPSTPVAP